MSARQRRYGAGEGGDEDGDTGKMKRFYTLVAGGTFLMSVVLACTLIPRGHTIATMSNDGEGKHGPRLDSAISAALEVASHQLKPEQIKFFRDRQAAISEQEDLNRKWEKKSVEHLVRLIQKTTDSDQQHEEDDLLRSTPSQNDIVNEKKHVGAHQNQNTRVEESSASFATRQPLQQSLAQSKTVNEHAGGMVSPQFQEDLEKMARERAAREEREEQFLKLREEKQAIKENRLKLLANARKDYQQARKEVVQVKDRLKDALAQRDKMTEAVRSHGFLSAKEALHQLAPIKQQVETLIDETASARKKWIAAKQALKIAEAIEEDPISLKSSSVAAMEV
ncbi:hypothetical protein GUITHDRAFT_106616 [Guillardia theta CCMP2712]|uniref:Transmembrane protein n=1 Tax=Guillardia theta (strain CCMP2712) TaxID=905079 RepID=L1JGH9_GUITC|nr:hypothetical protein GUITHDRAFT_106616 [Guillardia theta CCMP2712]EKX47628.1 hypothetical protein GUITHDRAFT_106616 [Guillardia theta CCMP2712]|eukprot:XP_005834608.1 hypothetical protein GUITHDRAFT_106616 [Guillardia theta CCMP2712]